MSNFEAPLNQPTLKQILKQKSPKIPNMCKIINRGTTSVHFDFACF